MESEQETTEKLKIFRLVSVTPSKTKFIAENLEITDTDKILEIDFVSGIIYNKKTLLLEINHNHLSSIELLRQIKSKIPQAKFYKNFNGAIQNNTTHASTIIQNLTNKGDDAIKTLFKGYADSQDLIFLFTSVMAIEEMIRNPAMPKWYDWFKMAQSAYSDIKTKEELKLVEEEIKISEQIDVEDFKKLITSINELKSMIEKKFIGDKTR